MVYIKPLNLIYSLTPTLITFESSVEDNDNNSLDNACAINEFSTFTDAHRRPCPPTT